VSHDDPIHVYENRYVVRPSWDNVLHFWRGPHENLYIPLTYTLWSAQAWLAAVEPAPGQQLASFQQLTPAVFHATNVAFHLANVLLVFLILRTLAVGAWPALLGALLFGVHPVQAESVAWISEFKGVLAAFLTLLALLLHLARARVPAGRRRRTLHVLALLAFVLALLSKPVAAVAPLLALVLDLAAGRRWKESAMSLIPWLAVLVPFAVVAKLAQPAAALGFVAPLPQRVLVALDALAFYLGKLAWPLDLGIDYGRSPAVVLGHWWGYATWAVPLAAAGLVLLRRRTLGWLAAPLALFCLGFLPVLGLIPFHHQDISTVADRYMYLPMLGPALGLALLAARLSGAWRLAPALLLAPLLGLAAVQVQTWRNYETLYGHAAQVNPDSAIAHKMLGFIDANAGRPDQAIAHYRQALRANPHYQPARLDLATLLYRLGRQDEAAGLFAGALQADPANLPARLDLGTILGHLNRHAEAAAQFDYILRRTPDNVAARMGLGAALYFLGRPADAAVQYQAVLAIDPGNARARDLLGQITGGGQ
jgi:Flp pilus assembly protein TadD